LVSKRSLYSVVTVTFPHSCPNPSLRGANGEQVKPAEPIRGAQKFLVVDFGTTEIADEGFADSVVNLASKFTPIERNILQSGADALLDCQLRFRAVVNCYRFACRSSTELSTEEVIESAGVIDMHAYPDSG
jgi:hypothetical protein